MLACIINVKHKHSRLTMLLRYSVENFKGFGSFQTLDMIATPRNEFQESLIQLNEKLNLNVNSNACVIGPNGSGKTHLLDSLAACSAVVLKRDFSEIVPFLLDDHSRNKPTSFSVTLYSTELNEFHVYSFSVFKNKVVSESLSVRKNETSAREKLIFQRDADGVRFSQDLKLLEDFIVPNLDDGGLVVSFAASIKNNNIKFIHEWFEGVIYFNSDLVRVAGPDTVNTILNKARNQMSKEWSDAANQFIDEFINDSCQIIKSLGIKIESLSVKNNEAGDSYLTITPQTKSNTKSSYTFEEAESFFSEGTFNVICLILIFNLLRANSKIILLDEVDGSFHHKLTKAVIDIFRKNHSKTQFIVSTHDALLLDYKFRRDSIFTVTKDDNYNSIIKRVSEFSIRKDAKLSAKYFADEFGALPNIMSIPDSNTDEV